MNNPHSSTFSWGLTRRHFMQAAATAVASAAGAATQAVGRQPAAENRPALKVAIFSKHLHWLEWDEMARTAAELGFDGVDLTLREGGHVLPERAEQDLPGAVAAVKKAGLDVPMVTAGIVDARSPHAEAMMRAMQACGIRLYRWGGMKWLEKVPIPERLAQLKQDVAQLSELNRKYGLCAIYHIHSGADVGAPVWDLWHLLKDFDRSTVAVNYDICHATIEGGLGAWVTNFRLIAPWIRGVAIKDFRWEKNEKGEWRAAKCPLGEGMVPFKRFFGMLRQTDFSGPVQVHYEYPLGGADTGRKSLTIERTQVLAAMRRDLQTLRGWLRESALA